MDHFSGSRPELLDALAYVYSKLSELLADCERHLKQQFGVLKFDHNPSEMRPLVMDRAEYVSIKTGAVAGHRLYAVPVRKDFKKKLTKRYGNLVDWGPLKRATTLEEVADAIFEQAQNVIKRDGYHAQIAMLFKGTTPYPPISWDHENRSDRYVIVREMAGYAKAIGADGVIFIGEAWIALKEDTPASGFAVEAKKKGEALCLTVANAHGLCRTMQTVFYRGRIQRKRVVRFEDSVVRDSKVQFMVAPFQLNWGAITEKDLEDFADENGIE